MSAPPAAYRYGAYGLCIDSAVPLLAGRPRASRLRAVGERARIGVGMIHHPPDARGGPSWWHRAAHGEVYLYCRGLARLSIRRGRKILVDPGPGAAGGRVRRAVSRWGLSVLLQQRGLLVLHGSSVELPEGAAVFLGAPGAGKSSLAGALCRRGHRLLADEPTVLKRELGGWVALPGLPEIDLFPGVAAALGFPSGAGGAGDRWSGKRAVAVEGSMAASGVPLKRIYVLSRDPGSAPGPRGARGGFRELIRHSYCAPLLVEMGLAEEHLGQCAELAASLEVLALSPGGPLPGLLERARRVEREAGREAP